MPSMVIRSGALVALVLAFPATAHAAAPALTGAAPAIDGPNGNTAIAVGQVLGCKKGEWDDPGSPNAYTYTYQWRNQDDATTVGTGDNYLVAASDMGDHLICRVTATNTGAESTPEDSASVTVGATAPAQVEYSQFGGTIQ